MNASHLLPSLLATLLLASLCSAETPAGPDDAQVKAAVLANDRAYEAAYAKADVKALADFFAEDAEFVTEDGRTFSGKAEIEKGMRAAFAAGKGSKLVILLESVKVLSPEVVLEKGSTAVTGKEGADGALFTAIHVKKNGQWKISHLVETPLPASTPHDHLEELAWLIGTWEDANKEDEVAVHSEFVWSHGGNFITRNVQVKRRGELTMEGWQVIGWDPLEERWRTWTFDSEGGFSGGTMTRDGDRWVQREAGVTPEGDRTTAVNTITKLGADGFTWESGSRTLNGDLQPSIARIEIKRMKGN